MMIVDFPQLLKTNKKAAKGGQKKGFRKELTGHSHSGSIEQGRVGCKLATLSVLLYSCTGALSGMVVN